jgi:WD40 repeat protein
MTADNSNGNLVLRIARSEAEQRIDDFEEAWQQGRQPAIEDYLPSGEKERAEALIELAHVDLERRLKAGEGARVEQYLQRFPELAPAALELIVAEYELRIEREPGLPITEYLNRFPQHGAELLARLGNASPAAEVETVAGAGTHRDADHPGPTDNVVSLAIPGYDILEELGRGGMGIVYKAHQRKLGRLVALKVVAAGSAADVADRTRFRTEAEAVARLQHPNIVQVFEVGEYDGRPYCAMEFVAGGTLQQRLSAGPLPPRQATALLEELARGAHAAHRAGVVHRDLKPANVLLASPVVLTPGESLTPKITDFGLAKRLDDDSGQTRSGTIIGTPSYMAPEQAAGQGKDVGPAADVYALGAILYECLTGRPPFKAALVLDTLEQVRSQEPVAPSRLQPKVPRDLETVCLKCLHKEPKRRYASAEALAEDLRRFRDGKPVQARPISTVERLAKWARRQPVVAALIVAIVAVTAAGFCGVFWQWQETKASLEAAEANLYAQRIALADREWLANHVDRAEQLLAECPPARRSWEWHYLSRLCHQELRSFDAGDSFGVAFSPDGKHIAAASVSRNAVLVWDVATGTNVLTLPDAGPAVAISPDGRFIASAVWKPGPAGEARADQACAVKVWEFPGGKEVRNFDGHTGAIFSLAFSPDSGRLATASLDHTVKVWDVKKGSALLTYKGHSGWVEGVALGAGGRLIASAGADGTVRVWRADSGKDQFLLGGTRQSERTKAHMRSESPKGGATAEGARTQAKVWNAATGQAVLSLRGQTHVLVQVAFAPDGKRLAASQGKVVQVWDVDTGREGPTLHGHTDLVRGLAFDPDGKHLASASYDQSLIVWELASGDSVATVRGHTAPVNGVAFSPDGKRLASAAWDGTVKLWDVEHSGEARRLGSHSSYARGLAFDPRSGCVASAGGDKVVRIWDPSGGNARVLAGHTDAVNRVAFHPTQPLLASAGDDGTVRLWDIGTGKEAHCLTGHTGKVYSVAVSDVGGRVASAGEDGTVRVWNYETGKEENTFRGHEGRVFAVAFQPHARRAASAGEDRVVRYWDADTGAEVRAFRGHEAEVTALAFSADGRRLASASFDRTVKVWDVATGKELLTLKGHSDAVTSVAFSPDGRRLVTTSLDRGVKVWDAERGQELLSLRGHMAEALGVSFSGDGRRLAVACVDGGVVMWDGMPPE